MRSSKLTIPSNSQIYHNTHFLSPPSPFLTLLPLTSSPNQYQSLQYSIQNPQIPKSFPSSRPIIAASMASSVPFTDTETKPFSILFVCMGNICRSPAAEGVFTDLVKKRGLDSKFIIDSAGTLSYHEGNQADPRMRASAKRRGIELTSIARSVKPDDFRNFDLILIMDEQNKDDIMAAYERWNHKEAFPPNAHKKVKMMCSYCKKHKETEVPDPYYGGPQGFEKVLDILEDACESLLSSILAENNHLSS